jgi:hypothetical protein
MVGLDATPLRVTHMEGDAAVPRAHYKLPVGSGKPIATQDRAIADDFWKNARIVVDGVEFGKAADFELQPVLRERARLFLALLLFPLSPDRGKPGHRARQGAGMIESAAHTYRKIFPDHIFTSIPSPRTTSSLLTIGAQRPPRGKIRRTVRTGYSLT